MDDDERFSMNEEARGEHWIECPNCGSDSIYDLDYKYECDECEFTWNKNEDEA